LAPFCSVGDGSEDGGEEEDWEALRGLRGKRGLEERELWVKEIEGLEYRFGEEIERVAEGEWDRRRGRRRWRKVAERKAEEEEERGNEAVLAVEEREWSAKLSIVNQEESQRLREGGRL